MKNFVVMVAFLMVVGAALADEHPTPAAQAKKDGGTLDGKQFAAELVKSGESSGDKDQLSFKGGKFLSSQCVQYGFHEAPYTASEKDGAMTWSSNVTNADGDTMSWTGTIKQGVIEGTAVLKSKSGGTTTYNYKGKAGHDAGAKKSEHPEHPKK